MFVAYLQSQVLHLHEVVRFIKLDRSKPEAMASLRLSIKRRLYKKYQVGPGGGGGGGVGLLFYEVFFVFDLFVF